MLFWLHGRTIHRTQHNDRQNKTKNRESGRGNPNGTSKNNQTSLEPQWTGGSVELVPIKKCKQVPPLFSTAKIHKCHGEMDKGI